MLRQFVRARLERVRHERLRLESTEEAEGRKEKVHKSHVLAMLEVDQPAKWERHRQDREKLDLIEEPEKG